MAFSRSQVGTILRAAGVPAGAFAILDREHAGVSWAWVQEAWEAWMAQLPEECVRRDEMGRPWPKYVPEGGDCDTITLSCYGHLVTGCWRGACARGEHFGRAVGVVSLRPRCSRDVNHFQIVFIDPDGDLWLFEPQNRAITRPNVAEAGSMQCGIFA